MAEIPKPRLGQTERMLLTLYALKELGPTSNLQLIAFMVEGDLMNYFDLQAALFDLCQRGQVIREALPGDDRYSISQEGLEALSLFYGRVAEGQLSIIHELAPAFKAKLQEAFEKPASISHAGRNEYHAQLGLREGGLDLLRLDFSLPTAELADRFCKAWPAKAQQIYELLLDALSGEEA